MTKLSVVLIVACSVILGIFSFVECVDDSAQPQNLLDRDQEEDAERAGARGTAQGNAQGRLYRPSNSPVVPVHLSCYSCADCPVILSNTSSKYCPASPVLPRQNKCVVYREKYSHMKEPWTIRGCASIRGSCAEIVANSQQQQNSKVLSCEECEGDLCNTSGVGRAVPSFIIATLALLVTPLMFKNLLS